MYLLIQQLLLNVYCVPSASLSAIHTVGAKARRQTDHVAETSTASRPGTVREDHSRPYCGLQDRFGFCSQYKWEVFEKPGLLWLLSRIDGRETISLGCSKVS